MMAQVGAQDPSVFENPIIRGFNPDPTICVVPATASEPARFFLSTSTFEYFPSCPIYTSTDLINWKLIGHALTRRSQIEMRTVEPGAGSWASTLRYRKEEKRWYLTTAVFQRYRPSFDERIFPRGFYVWTDDIWDEGKWSDPVYFDNPGFDQDLFWDNDGKVYLSTTVRISNRDPASKLKDFAIHISQIDLAIGRTLTPPVVIRQSQYGVAEGSHIIRKDKYYYLFVAEGGTEVGHQEWVFRSTDGVFGPWESQGRPLWYNSPDEEVQRTGHADVFEDGKGRWWAVFLGVRPFRRGRVYLEPQLGRETFLVKVDWVDDWPVFNNGKNVTLLTDGRDAVEQEITKTSGNGIRWRAKLDADELELGWYQKNTPLKRCYSLAERPGWLRLYGSCYNLSSPEAPSMLLRKQTSFLESFHTMLEFSPRKSGYEAGIVLWWSMYAYATIGLTAIEAEDGRLVQTIVCRKPEGHAGKIKTFYPLLEGLPAQAIPGNAAVELSAEACQFGYKMHVKHSEGTSSFAFDSEELTIMPPIGGAFTGAMFGVFAFGANEPVLDPADFSNIYIGEGTPGAV